MIELVRVHPDVCIARGAAGRKVFLPHRCHTPVLVDVDNVRDIDNIHVGLLHVNPATLRNICDVNPVNITRTAAIPGAVGLSWTEREPCRHAHSSCTNTPGENYERR